jgi:hypothetical protein
VESETRAKTRRGAPPPLNLFSLSLSLFSLVTSFTKGDRSPAGRAASAAALASSSARIFRRRARAAGTRAQGEREKVGGGGRSAAPPPERAVNAVPSLSSPFLTPQLLPRVARRAVQEGRTLDGGRQGLWVGAGGGEGGQGGGDGGHLNGRRGGNEEMERWKWRGAWKQKKQKPFFRLFLFSVVHSLRLSLLPSTHLTLSLRLRERSPVPTLSTPTTSFACSPLCPPTPPHPPPPTHHHHPQFLHTMK